MGTINKRKSQRTYKKVRDYFHNYEHDPQGRTHCKSKGKHAYSIIHDKGKHVISSRVATGHGRGGKPQKFIFTRMLKKGWDLASGRKV